LKYIFKLNRLYGTNMNATCKVDYRDGYIYLCFVKHKHYNTGGTELSSANS